MKEKEAESSVSERFSAPPGPHPGEPRGLLGNQSVHNQRGGGGGGGVSGRKSD